MKQIPRPNRATKPLSCALNQRLNVYALAASAAGASLLAMPPALQAEVVFTPAQLALNNGPLAIDLNHDGVVDFTLSDKSSGGPCCLYSRRLSVVGAFVGSSQNSIEGIGTNAVPLNAGAVIGPSDLFLAAPLRMATAFNDSNSFFYVFGPFANKTNVFLGLRFVLDGENHYGWARFTLVKAGFSGSKPVVRAILNGYAYETVANTPIVAGATKGQSASLATPSGESPTAATRQPAMLGLLALGSQGLSFWRREE